MKYRVEIDTEFDDVHFDYDNVDEAVDMMIEIVEHGHKASISLIEDEDE